MNQASSSRVQQLFPILLAAAAVLWGFVQPRGAGAVEEVKVRHILVRTRAEAMKALDELINSPGGITRENFINVARKFSKDHPSKGAGGDLGWNSRGKFVPEFADEAFATEVGSVSEPVRTQFGWHLIYVEDKRDTRFDREKSSPTAATPANQTPTPTTRPGTAGPNDLAPGAGSKITAAGKADPGTAPSNQSTGQTPAAAPGVTPATTPAAGQTPTAQITPTPQTTPTAAAAPVHPTLAPRSLKVAIEMPKRRVSPSEMVEVVISVANTGAQDLQFFSPDLLPLGLSVRSDGIPSSPPPSWDAVKEPAAPGGFLADLKSRSIIGGSYYLNDYFKDLPAGNRYWVTWDPSRIEMNFNQRFLGRSAQIEGFSQVKELLQPAARLLTREVKGLPQLGERTAIFRNEIPFAIFAPITTADKVFARIDVQGETAPIWFELFADRQLQGVQQFADLALDGFYDGLRLFDIQKDNYMRGGCPRNDGTGVPDRTQHLINSAKIPHQKGTLSLVSRSSRTGSEVGSNFFISLRDHPEWNEIHVPIGKVVQGQEALDRLGAKAFAITRTVAIVPQARAPQGVASSAAPSAAATTGMDLESDTPKILQGLELPRALIRTSKGDLIVELYQEDAPNTVSNFIDLALEKKFFNPDPVKGKEKLKILERQDPFYVRTGSPDNSDTGGPGHRIDSEVENNTRQHTKGTLSMCLEVDANGKPVPNTAGSQFFICLADVNYWDGLYTPFGKVIEGLDVLDKLQANDTIELVRVLSRRNQPYSPTVHQTP